MQKVEEEKGYSQSYFGTRIVTRRSPKNNQSIEQTECFETGMATEGTVAFPTLAKSKPSEVVIFAYAVFKSRKQRDATNKKIVADPRIAAICGEVGAIIDFKRMAYGGFKSFVEA